jgi:hypothetical protein
VAKTLFKFFGFYGKSTDYFVTSISMIQTKTIAMILLIAIATVGVIGIGIGTATQSVQAEERPCYHPQTAQVNRPMLI